MRRLRYCVAHTLARRYVTNREVDLFKKVEMILTVIILVPVVIYGGKIALSEWNANEEANSSLLVSTCEILPYKGVDCEQYKSLASKLEAEKISGVTREDVICLSSSAISAELPSATPPVVSDMITKKVLNIEELPECDTGKALDSILRALDRTLGLKEIEQSATTH